MVPRLAGATPIKAAVVRSQGTIFLGMTIWNDLNTGWFNFGDVPVQIDYTSLAGNGLTLSQITNTQADVLIISTAGFLSYTDAEVNAVKDYVQSGHGIIITYDSFMTNKRVWAPLVGLSDSIALGTGTFSHGINFDLLQGNHPLFNHITTPYQAGAPAMAVPADDGLSWQVADGSVIAEALAPSGTITAKGIISAHEASTYRGLYFAHYIEDKADGSNLQDMQVFYNGLLWTAGVPEPGAGLLILAGAGILSVKRG